MKARDIMTTDVLVVSPETSIQEVAQAMAENDIGALPVCDGRRLLGMVTDRDIAIRAVARGAGPETTAVQVMSHEIVACYEDDDLDEVRVMMSEKQIRRVPVLDSSKNLIGIIALGDVATHDTRDGGEALEEISRPN